MTGPRPDAGGLVFDNPKVQYLRRLVAHRRERTANGEFVVEGPLLISEAMAAGWELARQFVAPGSAAVPGAGVTSRLAAGVLERVGDTETPRGVIAIVKRRPATPGSLERAKLAVVVDRVADPGNVGTILRSAEAAGIATVVVTAGTADPFAPKVVRASAGALFHLDVLDAELDAVRRAGLRLIGTSSHRGDPHTSADWSGRIAIVVGNEARGLDDAPIDSWVRIVHHGRAESLNVAMATTLLCFEAVRQRSNDPVS